MTSSEHKLEWPGMEVAQHLLVAPQREAIASVIAWIEEAGERQHWPAHAVFALTLCADEALTNIISHARAPANQALDIALALGSTAYGTALGIADNGAAFDPTAQASAKLALSLDDAEIGGHGLRLMRHYLHEFSYRREGERNLLLLGVGNARPDQEV